METLHNKDKHVKCKDGQQFQLGNTPISQPWYMWQKRSSIFNNFDDTYAPPNNCIPRSAKIRMNKKRRNSRLMMERIEASSEMTRLRSDDQYLCIRYVILINWIWIDQCWPVSSTMCTRHCIDQWMVNYLVTLKILSRRKARSTEKPNEPPFTSDQITSNILPNMTWNIDYE